MQGFTGILKLYSFLHRFAMLTALLAAVGIWPAFKNAKQITFSVASSQLFRE